MKVCTWCAPLLYVSVLGDPRTNQHPPLLAFGILFHRWHNVVASRVQQENPRMTDEEVFQRARRIVVATLQVIFRFVTSKTNLCDNIVWMLQTYFVESPLLWGKAQVVAVEQKLHSYSVAKVTYLNGKSNDSVRYASSIVGEKKSSFEFAWADRYVFFIVGSIETITDKYADIIRI